MIREHRMSSLTQNGSTISGTLMLTVFLSASILVIGMVVGVVIGTGESIIPLALVFALAGLVIAFFPNPLFWGTVILGMLVAGVTRLYVPALQEIRWLLVPASLALLCHGLITRRKSGGIELPLFMWLITGFGLLLCLSSIVNSVPTAVAALGIKGYVQLWGVMFGLALIPFSRSTIDLLLRVMLVIAFLQIPLAAHQFYKLVPLRYGLEAGIVPVDVVAGSFGARRFGGGENSVLSAYLVICITFLTALWRNGALRTWLFLVMVGPLFWPIIVTESKISAIYMVVAFVTLAMSFRLGRKSRVIGMTLSFTVLITVLLSALIAFAPKANQVRSLSDLIAYTWSYNIASDTSFGGRLSRAGAYRYWAEQHDISKPVSILIGNGAGVTRKPTPSQELVADTQFDMELEIGRTGATAVLWEAGVIGLLLVLGVFVSAFRVAGKLAKQHRSDPRTSAMFTGVQAGVAVLFISFFDKSYFVFQIGYQTIFALLLGYLAWWIYHDAVAVRAAAVEKSRGHEGDDLNPTAAGSEA